MWSLETIIEMNQVPAVEMETNHNRNCSFAGDSQTGVVLHSARQRNTVFLRPWAAKRFLAKWYGTNSQESRNKLVESYF